MRGLLKRKIIPDGKRITSPRVRTPAERKDANFGATEKQVTPLTPPPSISPDPDPRRAADQLDPSDELTPG